MRNLYGDDLDSPEPRTTEPNDESNKEDNNSERITTLKREVAALRLEKALSQREVVSTKDRIGR